MGLLIPKDLKVLRHKWRACWEEALAAWSRFTKLAEPRWCFTHKEEKAEKLADSFAMIRLTDHAVVISLRQIKDLGLDELAVEILAHEIGHHVYAPGDLRDNARLLARVRAGLPTREETAGLIANLYTDLLINDRLRRGAGLNMAGVYKKLKVKGSGRLWTLYMQIYENLWRLRPGELSSDRPDKQIRSDASLGARLIRVYGKDWLSGAGRFAVLCLPYVLEDTKKGGILKLPPWLDAGQAGAGEIVPDGLAEIEAEEIDGVIHPAEDPDLTGLGELPEEEEGASGPLAGGQAETGGRKNKYREPNEYTELMKSLGVELPEDELIIHYYRERALPHLIRFPTRETPEAADPLPEGLDMWETGSPLAELDWVESLIRSPDLIPGLTTVRRTYGTTAGGSPERQPVDLFLGVDCSGSMKNPRLSLSYPVLAGTIIVLSALRTGARVKVTLSGEPGRHSSTDGFIRHEKEILKVLTGYLGTGYAFGIRRLEDTFLKKDRPSRPTHILIVTDMDIFSMLKDVPGGWDLARRALETAGGGGTYVLNIHPGYYQDRIDRMTADGWDVHCVTNWEELVTFARAFSKIKYAQGGCR